jgi:hypothetical protein
MSKKDKSQRVASGADANLVERWTREMKGETTDVAKIPSVTNESEDPSASLSCTGTIAESRPSAVTMKNINTRKNLFWVCVSTIADSNLTVLPFKVDDFFMWNTTVVRFGLSFFILKNDKSNQDCEIACYAGDG